MAGMDLPAKAIREQIAGAVDLIVQISRMSDGSRKLISITEVVGMQGDTVTLQEVFRFKEEGFDKNRKIVGQFQALGLIPTFIEDFEQRGVNVPRNLFMSAEQVAVKPTHKSTGPTPPSIPRLSNLAPKKTGSGGGGTELHFRQRDHLYSFGRHYGFYFLLLFGRSNHQFSASSKPGVTRGGLGPDGQNVH